MLLKSPYFLLVISLILVACKKEKIDITCLPAQEECLATGINIDSTCLGRKVLVIGIDGFRSEALQAGVTPFMYQLSQRGTTFYTGAHKVEDITVSGPNWASLCTGVHWCKHGVDDNDFGEHALADYPHFFQYIEEAESDLNTLSIVNWLPVNTYIASGQADYAPELTLNDLGVFLEAEEALINQEPLAPDVLFLHFDELDGAGHRFGYGSHIPEYNEVLTTLDTYVNDLFSIIENKRINGEDWLVFIVSDHGGDGTGHGGGQNNDFINKTVFFANNPNVSFVDNHTTSQVDLAPTILAFLGINSEAFSCKTDGISILN